MTVCVCLQKKVAIMYTFTIQSSSFQYCKCKVPSVFIPFFSVPPNKSMPRIIGNLHDQPIRSRIRFPSKPAPLGWIRKEPNLTGKGIHKVKPENELKRRSISVWSRLSPSQPLRPLRFVPVCTASNGIKFWVRLVPSPFLVRGLAATWTSKA